MSEKSSTYTTDHNESDQEAIDNSRKSSGNESFYTKTDTVGFRVKKGEDIFCPNPSMPLWSSHPKVFLDASSGSAVCPYCGMHYVLLDEKKPL